MIVVRTVRHARFGKAGEFAAEFKSVAAQVNAEMGTPGHSRVLTEWEQSRARLFQVSAFREWLGRIQAARPRASIT